jgi:hypothetical protein
MAESNDGELAQACRETNKLFIGLTTVAVELGVAA